MNRIQHIIEPTRLWLVWQPGELDYRPRRRHIVGEIVRYDDGALLQYLTDTEDFKKAVKAGFVGYPAFKLGDPVHKLGVIDTFMRRLPPRKRDDFHEYLERYRLPEDFSGSDMALLGYTGAKLPSDGFEIYADLAEASTPFEIVLEIAGFRHQSEYRPSDLAVGESVEFVPDPENAHDSMAISIRRNGKMLGWVSRQHLHEFHEWYRNGFSVSGVIERINGTPERPLVYIFVKVR